MPRRLVRLRAESHWSYLRSYATGWVSAIFGRAEPCPLFPGRRRTLMRISKGQFLRLAFIILLAFVFIAASWAQSVATVSGTVFDPVGQRISGAKLELLRNAEKVAEGKSGGEGNFILQ